MDTGPVGVLWRIILTVLFAGGQGAPRTPHTEIGGGLQPPLHGHLSAFPSQSQSRGSGGSAPGMVVWEGVMIRRVAPHHRILTAISRRGFHPRTPTDEDRLGRRWNRIHTYSLLLKRERERARDEKFSSRMLEPEVHAKLP
ncbi:hypothetical protein J2129_001476 [Methanofollis sp. W23]|nr:hypothetical protein [Methanofollis sp. W23]